MTRAKIIIVSLLALVGLGVVGGVGFLIVRALSTPAPTTPVAVATPGAETPPTAEGALQEVEVPGRKPAIEEDPEPPYEPPPEYLKQVVIYPEGSLGLPGEAPGVTAYDLVVQRTPESTAGEVVIPQGGGAGTGGGSAAPTSVEGSADPDKDGLTNDQENQQGTDANKADTDGDGLNDGDEARRYRTDPKVRDTDGDELSDGEEVNTYKTDPLNPDSDGDTFKDGAEVKAGYNPRGPGKL